MSRRNGSSSCLWCGITPWNTYCIPTNSASAKATDQRGISLSSFCSASSGSDCREAMGRFVQLATYDTSSLERLRRCIHTRPSTMIVSGRDHASRMSNWSLASGTPFGVRSYPSRIAQTA